MDQDERQNERNQLSVVQTRSALSQSSGDRQMQRNKRYLAESAELVRRTLSLSNQPSLTETELGQRAMDWQDAFEGIIPITRLMDAFNAALRQHKGSFPVNAFEIIDAWRQIAGNGRPVNEAEFQRRLMQQGGGNV